MADEPTEESSAEELRSALAEALAEVERLRTTDPVTGCLSRQGFAGALTLHEGKGAALLFDCDDFRRVNDQHGFAAGDTVLRQLAARLRDALGNDAPLARIGGNLFLALVVGAELDRAREVAEVARLAVAATPLVWEPSPVSLTVSVGLVRLQPHLRSVDALLDTARIALRKSKALGKNRVSTPDESSTSFHWFEPSVRDFVGAVQSGAGLVMHAQSIRALVEQHTVGWELLVRGPAGPLQSPGDLFRMAEEHRLTVPLDLQCLRLGVAAARQAGLKGILHLNLLPATLLATDPGHLLELLGPPPEGARWCLELSERQFFGAPAELVDAVAFVRAHGVRVAIDDLGSCHGTMDSLVALEPDVAKLDIRLVSGLAADPRRAQLVRRLVRMCDALCAEVVAEGVEVAADLEVLRDLGVPFGQGWIWDRAAPLPVEGVAQVA